MQVYLFEVLWIAMVIYWALKSTSDIWAWMFWVAAAAGGVSLVFKILRTAYFEIAGDKLVINVSVFKTRIIELNKIEKFVIEPSPFSNSKIVLKDKTEVKYSYSQTDDGKLRELMAQYVISVE